jgi:hypothetical protein
MFQKSRLVGIALIIIPALAQRIALLENENAGLKTTLADQRSASNPTD